MLPHHVITAVTLLAIDLAHTLPTPSPEVIGAAAFTGSIEDGRIGFTLQAFVRLPADHPSSLLSRLDLALADDRATVTGYDLKAMIAALEALPDAQWSSAIRTLSGCGHQPVIDTVLRSQDRVAVGFMPAALSAGIPCSTPSPGEFARWVTGRTTPLIDRLEIDAVASWRLAMANIAERSSLGRHVNAAIERHLAEWLRRTGGAAAAAHLDSLARTAG